MPCQLYLISPPQIDDLDAFAAQLEAALKAGNGEGTQHVGAFQLRLKQAGVTQPEAGRTTLPTASDALIIAAAKKLRPICHAYEVAFLLNDRAEMVEASNADGVHVGQEDEDIRVLCSTLSEEITIGATCHDSPHLAMVAAENGADYVAFGAFHPTASKTPEALAKWGTPTTAILEWWSTYTEIPCVAIGGITAENAPPLVQAGADFIAVITAVWQHPEGPAAAVKEFAEIFASAA